MRPLKTSVAITLPLALLRHPTSLRTQAIEYLGLALQEQFTPIERLMNKVASSRSDWKDQIERKKEMTPPKIVLWFLAALSIAAFSLGCNFLTQISNPAKREPSAEEGLRSSGEFATQSAQVPGQDEFTPSSTAEQNTKPFEGEGSMALIRQWASEALASSSYDEENWAASQATGEPDTLECGDFETAWASATSNSREWLIVYFPQPVYAVEVNLYETDNPDQVVSIELIDLQGQFVTVYTATPRRVETCPYRLSVPTAFSGVLAQGVRVTIDQSLLSLGWNEIDAVEIVGAPGEGTPVRPIIP